MMHTVDKQIAQVAALIGDATRSSILVALMEGRALIAGELALRANISPQTASNHLKRLQESKLIELIKTPTRYRYYKISSLLVAQALESLSVLLPQEKKEPPRHNKLQKDICFARTCYDHLAGELGVKLTQAFLEKKIIVLQDDSFEVTETGKHFFNQLEINCDQLMNQKRPFAKACLDWTEREYHLAGNLGAAFLDYLLNEHMLLRSKTQSRVVTLTQKGRDWINKNLTSSANF